VCGGCFGTVFHLERDAPGPGPVRDPPSADLGVGQRVRPEDPGEQSVTVAPELTLGGGLWDRRWSVASSGQIAAWYGEHDHSHVADQPIGGDSRIAPLWSVGGAVGYDVLPLGGADRRATLTFRATDEGMGLEAGWVWEPTNDVHSGSAGVFLSSWSRFFYLRALWGPERGWGVESGLALDYGLTWVWSR
jgi:hypothetical protein